MTTSAWLGGGATSTAIPVVWGLPPPRVSRISRGTDFLAKFSLDAEAFFFNLRCFGGWGAKLRLECLA